MNAPSIEIKKAKKINSSVTAYRFAQAEIAVRWKRKGYDAWAEMLGNLWQCEARTVRERAQVADFRRTLAHEFGRWIYKVDYSMMVIAARYEGSVSNKDIAETLEDALAEGVTFEKLSLHLQSLLPSNNGDMTFEANRKIIGRKFGRLHKLAAYMLTYDLPAPLRDKATKAATLLTEVTEMLKNGS